MHSFRNKIIEMGWGDPLIHLFFKVLKLFSFKNGNAKRLLFGSSGSQPAKSSKRICSVPSLTIIMMVIKIDPRRGMFISIYVDAMAKQDKDSFNIRNLI